ncbi:MAG: Phosphate acetyltransferase [Haliscomenobacter sp.]|nr:Phosphate acetyltransferase [Haliscomenobacter sp.]
MKNIYVAASSQHVGKTTCTLGLVANLVEQGFTTGYSKPVGQKSVAYDGRIADKDAVLFSEVIGFDIDPDIHSPVIIGRGVTKEFIENPNSTDFEDRLKYSRQVLENQYDVVVYEGTGHPGVGSVVNLSNARVAKMLDAGVIMVVEGGIGSTIDMLNMCTALFREEKVPVLGVIVNKVKQEKMEEIEYFLSRRLESMGMPLLGVLPYDSSLSLAIMETIRQAVDGKIMFNEDSMNNKVEDIVAGSLVDVEEFNTFENILLVTSFKRLNQAIDKVQSVAKIKGVDHCPLSGVIVTSDGRQAKWFEQADLANSYLLNHKVPVITTTLDTYGSVVKISRIEVKINNRTPWKSRRAIELVRQHVNFNALIEQFHLRKIS